MSQPRFTTRQLSAFIAAAELGNFTLAAGRINLTPSAVSNLISELEQGLGFSLFERTTRKIALTADGRKFLPMAIGVQRQFAIAASAATDIANRAVDVVRVAAPQAIAATLLPPLIAAFRKHDRQSEVRIIDTGVEWMANRLMSGEADLALGPDRSVSEEIGASRLFASPWVLWCSPEHPLVARRQIKWSELEGVDFFTAGHDHEQSVEPLGTHSNQQISNMPKQVFDNITTALGMAAANLGVTFSPLYVDQLARPMGLTMRRVVDPEVLRYVTLYEPVDRTIPEQAKRFRDFVRSNFAAGTKLKVASTRLTSDGDGPDGRTSSSPFDGIEIHRLRPLP